MKSPRCLLLCSLMLSLGCQLSAAESQVVPLWPKGAPGSEERRNEPEQAESYWVKNVHNPSITVFQPPKEKATGAAMLVCPGGGHRLLVWTAEYLNSIGVAAFVLKYRLGREEDSPCQVNFHPRQDAHRAMRVIRSRAAEWGVDPNRLGAMGFSAGGEVVSMITYAEGRGDFVEPDPIGRLDGSPNYQVLVYPGPLGIPDVLPTTAPPAFLVVANDDKGASGVIASLFQKYRDVKAPVEAHIYQRGGHTFNMGKRSKLATLKGWPQRLTDWLEDNQWLKPAENNGK